MNWSRFVRCVRWLAELLRDLHHDDWRQRRAVRRETDRRLGLWRELPEDEAVKWVHPASPTQPEGWSLEAYKENQRRHRGPAH